MINSTGIDNVEQNCMICGRPCSDRRSLGNHLARSHPEVGGMKTYFLQFWAPNGPPKCACGCGKVVEWHKSKFQFNEYLTGHNKTGFRAQQPNFTQEQIDRRVKSIRRVYKEKKDEIRKKISKSVSVGLNQPSVKDHLSDVRKDLWSSDEYKEKQRESRIKSWEGEAGDERRLKVFTPEFGRKIGLANMARVSSYTSKAEEAFSSQLTSHGLTHLRSVWFNLEEKTWNADLFFPEEELIVEFDGIYWHGLDRAEDWTLDQIKNLTNDLRKNRLAKERGLSLLRISSSADPSTIQTLDDLKSLAHHYVHRGEVIKEGTFRLGDDTPLITRDTLLKIGLRDGGSEYLEGEYLPALGEFWGEYVAYWGWFYPQCGTPLTQIMSAVADASETLGMSPAGSDWLKSRVPSYWNVDGGPAQSLHDPKILRDVLSYRMGLNNSKDYTYVLSDGSRVTTRETFHISPKDLRTGFMVKRSKVSWFKPAWAAHIYRRFLEGVERPVVWDPSIGFSARMLGFASLFREGEYIGTDPCSHMIRDARAISEQILEVNPTLNIRTIQCGSETFTPPEGSLDLVFTSPPYFNTERYYDEPGQCWRDYPDLPLWRDQYLLRTLQGARRGLKAGRPMVINISPQYRVDVIETAERAGFALQDEIRLKIGRDHFSRKRGDVQPKYELFLSFR